MATHGLRSVAAALRQLSQARHVGKVVVSAAPHAGAHMVHFFGISHTCEEISRTKGFNGMLCFSIHQQKCVALALTRSVCPTEHTFQQASP